MLGRMVKLVWRPILEQVYEFQQQRYVKTLGKALVLHMTHTGDGILFFAISLGPRRRFPLPLSVDQFICERDFFSLHVLQFSQHSFLLAFFFPSKI